MSPDSGRFTVEEALPHNGRVVIGQREYAILAPERDKLVSKAVTSGMSECFALSLHDRQNRVGMFSHLDIVDEEEPFLDDSVSQLLALGAFQLEITTVNFIRYPNRLIFMLNLIKLLADRGLRKESLDWPDLGVSNSASFNPVDGLYPAEYKDIELTADEVDATDRRRIPVWHAYYYKSPLPPIRCAYTPIIN